MDGCNSGKCNNRKINQNRKAIAAAIGAAALWAMPHCALADFLYDGTNSPTSSTAYIDGGDWFNADNWENSSGPVQGAAPPLTSTSDTINIDANTSFVGFADGNLVVDSQSIVDSVTAAGGGAVQGVVYDPVADVNAGNPNSYTLPSGPSYSVTAETIYIGSNSSATSGGVQPNLITINSGTLEAGASTSQGIGRDATGEVIQNGGSFISDEIEQLGINHSNGNVTGIYNYKGGLLQVGINSSGTSYTGSSGGLRMGTNTGAIGILDVHHPGGSSQGSINLDNLYLGYVSGGMGLANFYYENGGVTPVQVTGGNASPANSGTQGQLTFRNYAVSPTFGAGTGGSGGTIGSILNFTLNSAPTLQGNGAPQNLALFTYADGIHGNSTNDKDLFSVSGTDLTEGSTITESFGGNSYSWNLYYDGSVTFSNAATSAIASIGGQATGSETGIGAVVLIGQVPIPEPTALGLLSLGALALRRRRRPAKPNIPPN